MNKKSQQYLDELKGIIFDKVISNLNRHPESWEVQEEKKDQIYIENEALNLRINIFPSFHGINGRIFWSELECNVHELTMAEIKEVKRILRRHGKLKFKLNKVDTLIEKLEA